MQMIPKPNSSSQGVSFKLLLLLKHPSGWLWCLLWLILIAPVQAAIDLRIAIKKNVSEVQVGSSTVALVRDASGRKLGAIDQMSAFSVQPRGSGVALSQWQSSQLEIEPIDGGYVWIGDRWYRGTTRLVRQGQGIIAINRVNLEDYLYSVVGAEAFPNWPLEALKAQAVAARTYALYKSKESGNRFYDLDTTTATQVYKGLNSEYDSTQLAVQETTGQVLTYNGQIIMAVFHSSSGGHTENVEDVWSSRLPYLRGVVDYDQTSPVFQWTKTFSGSELGNLLGGVGTVKTIVPERTSPLGRLLSVRVVGDRGSKRLTGTQLRESLDLKSTLVTVLDNNGVFQIDGRGYGHGIGLSQWGTYYLAQQNIGYQRILSHYYQNVRVTQMKSR